MVSSVDTAEPATAASAVVRQASVGELIGRARALVRMGRRTVLGIAGPPGAGKSTVAAAIAQALAPDAVLVAMDGFHLADDELVRLGRRDRKGAPDTFDVDGYVSLLRRLRAQDDGLVYAPRFDRGLEAAVAGAVPVTARTPLVITEGNYLLLDDFGWRDVHSCLDEVWFLDVPRTVRDERLVGRRRSFGDSPDDARAWVQDVDRVNGLLVEATRDRADLVAELGPDPTRQPKER